MISQTAIESLEELKAEGLEPSFADVIRLNALGLRLEASRKRNSADSLDYLPRVAAVSKTLSFRQPTVGHEIWLDRIERLLPPGDYQSLLAVKAFALSRPANDLPDPDDPRSIKKAVDSFCADCRDLTRDQIYAAIEYVLFGADPTANECSAVPSSGSVSSPQGDDDFRSCIALGVLNEGRAVLWGIDAAEMKAMPRRQLEDVIRRAYVFHGMSTDGEANRLEGQFYATVDEIAARLKKETNRNG